MLEPIRITDRVGGESRHWEEKAPLKTHAPISFSRGETKRGIGLEHPEAWYFNPRYTVDGSDVKEPKRIILPIDIELNPVGTNSYKLTKIVPASLFAGAHASGAREVWTDTTSTFNPEGGTATVDGFVYKSGGPALDFYSIATSTNNLGSNSTSDPENIAYLGTAFSSNQWDELYRGIFLFDTSTIPSNEVVSAATFSLYGNAKNDAFSQSVGLVTATPASTTALTSTDYNQTGGVHPARLATDLTISSLSTSGYNDWTLSQDGLRNISETGVSEFATRLSGDIDLVPPSWTPNNTSKFKAYTADEPSTDKDPKLVVTSIAPSSKVRKPANQSRANSATLSPDYELTVTVATSTSYIVDATVFVEASSSIPDLKIRFTAPAGSELDLGYTAATTSQEVLSNNQTSNTIPLDGNTPTVVHITGTVKTGTTAGILEFDWAQATSDSAYVTVRRGSYVRVDAL